jgi:GcrA cell cycle regulator
MNKQEVIAGGIDRWTRERVATLKKLYQDDLSASEIAAELGEGFTRNAVLGKIHRLKLPAGREPRQFAAPKPKPVRRKPATRPAAPIAAKATTSGKGLAFRIMQAKNDGLAFVDAMAAVLGRDLVHGLGDSADGRPLLRLEQLTEATCKWPFGDPLKPGFGFCGDHSLENSPYCAIHKRRAIAQRVPQ